MATAIIDENGDATYEFNTPAAWDGLCLEDRLLDLILKNDKGQQSTKVFVMGTIAGRLKNDHGATSLTTLMTIRNNAPEGSVVLDVNLRSPWYTPETVLKLAQGTAKEGSDSSEEKKSQEVGTAEIKRRGVVHSRTMVRTEGQTFGWKAGRQRTDRIYPQTPNGTTSNIIERTTSLHHTRERRSSPPVQRQRYRRIL